MHSTHMGKGETYYRVQPNYPNLIDNYFAWYYIYRGFYRWSKVCEMTFTENSIEIQSIWFCKIRSYDRKFQYKTMKLDVLIQRFDYVVMTSYHRTGFLNKLYVTFMQWVQEEKEKKGSQQ